MTDRPLIHIPELLALCASRDTPEYTYEAGISPDVVRRLAMAVEDLIASVQWADEPPREWLLRKHGITLEPEGK